MKVLQAEVDPHADKIDSFADSMGDLIIGYRTNLEQQVGPFYRTNSKILFCFV